MTKEDSFLRGGMKGAERGDSGTRVSGGSDRGGSRCEDVKRDLRQDGKPHVSSPAEVEAPLEKTAWPWNPRLVGMVIAFLRGNCYKITKERRNWHGDAAEKAMTTPGALRGRAVRPDLRRLDAAPR